MSTECRQGFVAQQLGEEVVTIEGQLWRLTSISPRDGPEKAYNFEVSGEHVYYVSSQGLLVHNSYGNEAKGKASNTNKPGLADGSKPSKANQGPEAERAFQPGNRISDKLLFSKDKFAKSVQQITEARRTIGKSDIAAERLKFLGENAVKVGPGKWRSIDGARQFRVKPNDLLGKHGNIGPHVHFEFLKSNAIGTKLQIWKNIHIPLR